MKSKIFLICLGLILLSTIKTHAEENCPIQESQIALQADTIASFIPKGWVIEQEVNGNLNEDQQTDKILQLIEEVRTDTNSNTPPPRCRALIILLGVDQNHWARAGFSKRALQCTQCGGAFSEEQPSISIIIENGFFILTQTKQRAGYKRDMHYKLKYDKLLKRFALVEAQQMKRSRDANVRESRIDFSTRKRYITQGNVAQQDAIADTYSEDIALPSKTIPQYLEDLAYQTTDIDPIYHPGQRR